MKCLILANGYGERLVPVTYFVNKCMMPINGIPVLEYIVKHLASYNIKDLVIAVGEKKEQIMRYFGAGKTNAGDFGVHISYSINENPQGTAGELASASEFFRGQEDFLIYYGDTLTNIDLNGLYRIHKTFRATITLTGIVGLPLDTGIMQANILNDGWVQNENYSAGKITKFTEKPTYKVITNVPVFYCSKEIWASENIKEGKDFSLDVFPEFVQQDKVFLYLPAEGFHYDVGSLDRLERINKAFKQEYQERPKVIK